jgi:membrane-bound metal-dependent hydrolase YbcI (DUF457 family)
MPLTPLHLAAGLPLRKYVSIKSFIIVNILIDLEPVAILIFGMDKLGYPLHQAVHSFGGATLMILITMLLGFIHKPDFNKWFYGAALGGYSHILLDALVHADVTPFGPFMEGNPLFLDAHAEVSILCAVVLTYYLAKWVESLRVGEIVSRWIKNTWR